MSTKPANEIKATTQPAALDCLFDLPADGRISQDNHSAVLASLEQQRLWIRANPEQAALHVARILSCSMSVLPLAAESSAPAEPERASVICPRRMAFDVKWKERYELTLKGLDVISALVDSVKKSKLLCFWHAFLPGCSRISGLNWAIFDLIRSNHPQEVRAAALNILNKFFDKSSSFLQLANAKCRISSFTPICYEFAESLSQLVALVVDELDADSFMEPQWANLISRTLVVLLEQVPFHKLKDGLLTAIGQRVLNLSPAANPVIQIAVLQICSALASVVPANGEVLTLYHSLFQLFLSRSFSELHHDNNIRYVAIQDLGKLAQLDMGRFLESLPSLMKCVHEAMSDPDQAIILHVLRLLKTVGKCGGGSPQPGKLLHFWLEIVSSDFLRRAELRDSVMVKAALCDCLAEIGGSAFSLLPQDRKILCITYLLRHCHDQDHRLLASAFRGLGMFATFPSCQDDAAFLIDCADILLKQLDRAASCQSVHKNVALSGTWAMASLADTLCKQQPDPSADTGVTDASTVVALDFPPHLLLQLATVAVTFGQQDAHHSHMNTRANAVRSLGSLILCFDRMACSGIAGPGHRDLLFAISSQNELKELCASVVSTLVQAISVDKVMKVRWNACYAAGAILRTQMLFASADGVVQKTALIDALVPLIQSFPNFKVRINAAFALKCIPTRQVLVGERYRTCILAVAGALDTASVLQPDVEDEGQHQADLVDQLSLSLCHLVSQGDACDWQQLDTDLHNMAESLRRILTTVFTRISPEKSCVLMQAGQRLVSQHEARKKYPTLVSIFSGLDVF